MLIFLKSVKFIIKFWQIQCVIRACFLVPKWPSFHCVFMWQMGQGRLRAYFTRPLISFTGVPPSWPNHLPPLNIISIGNFGDGGTQSFSLCQNLCTDVTTLLMTQNFKYRNKILKIIYFERLFWSFKIIFLFSSFGNLISYLSVRTTVVP